MPRAGLDGDRWQTGCTGRGCDPNLEAEGKAERVKGEIKDTVGKAKDKVRDVVDEATE
jgi:uncharacterized protein YjbJ (UPF0337 family)